MLHQGLGTGGKNLDKEDELLELMKKLVVKKRIVLMTKVASWTCYRWTVKLQSYSWRD